MKRVACLIMILAAGILAACDPYPVTSTLSPGQMVAAGQAALNETATEVARQTQQAYEATMIVKNATQDAYNYQQAVYASQTANAAEATQQIALITARAATAQAYQETQAAKTLDVRHTDAAYTATSNAAQTADAENYDATHTAAAKTQTADDIQAALNTSALHAQETSIANQAELGDLAVERTKMTNTLLAIGPFVVIAITVLIVLLLIWRWGNIEANRRRWIENDERGDKKIRDDGRTVYDPDRNPGAAVTFPDNRLIVTVLQRLELLPPGEKDLVAALVDQLTTERDQLLDMMHRGLASGQSQAPRSLPEGVVPPSMYTQTATGPMIEIGDPRAQPVRGWIDEVEMKLLED